MSSLLPSRTRLRGICLMLQKRPEPLYLVGGYVRDWLLGRESHDLDFAMDGDAIGLARRMANRFRGHFVLLDREHNTARAVFKERGASYNVDIAGIRGHEILADLRARDFTMNAVAVSISDLDVSNPPLIDPTLGQADIEQRMIRATSDHAFRDDPIRMLRAVRQAASLGFAIVPSTEALVIRDAHLLGEAAGERICAELAQMLTQPGMAEHWRYLGRLGLIAPTLPEIWALREMTTHGENAYELALRTVAAVERLLQNIDGLVTDRLAAPVVRYAPFLHEHFGQVLADTRDRASLLKLVALLCHMGGEPSSGQDRRAAVEEILRRLRFSVREIGVAQRTLRGLAWSWDLVNSSAKMGPSLSARECYRFFRDLGDASVDSICLALALDWAAGPQPSRQSAPWAPLAAISEQLLDYYANEWPGITASSPLLNGRQLMRALGLRGGPTIGQLLESLREAQAVGELTSEEEALSWARAWLSRHPEA